MSCAKPMTMNVSEALRLRDRVESSGKLFGLMHITLRIRWFGKCARWYEMDCW